MSTPISSPWDKRPEESMEQYWQRKGAGFYQSLNTNGAINALREREESQRIGALEVLTDAQREKFRLQWQEIFNFNKAKQQAKPEAQLIQNTLSEVADEVALAGAVNYQFAPLKNVLDGLESILRYKNKAYGNSGLSEVGVLSKSSALEKLLARADDKIARIKNSEVLRKNDVCDLMGYLVLICAKQGWNNFSDQQD